MEPTPKDDYQKVLEYREEQLRKEMGERGVDAATIDAAVHSYLSFAVNAWIHENFERGGKP
jgi:hypothetical protein